MTDYDPDPESKKKRKKPTQTAAQKRGLGAGWAKALGMEHAYDSEVLNEQRSHVCRHRAEAIRCEGPDTCPCLCHETYRFVHKFKL